jgi:hypothetical protein
MLARWPVVIVENRSRAELGWESAVEQIGAHHPSVLVLPGNPDMRVPLDVARIPSLISPALRILK